MLLKLENLKRHLTRVLIHLPCIPPSQRLSPNAAEQDWVELSSSQPDGPCAQATADSSKGGHLTYSKQYRYVSSGKRNWTAVIPVSLYRALCRGRAAGAVRVDPVTESRAESREKQWWKAVQLQDSHCTLEGRHWETVWSRHVYPFTCPASVSCWGPTTSWCNASGGSGSYLTSGQYSISHFTALHRSCISYKLKASRPSTSKKDYDLLFGDTFMQWSGSKPTVSKRYACKLPWPDGKCPSFVVFVAVCFVCFLKTNDS